MVYMPMTSPIVPGRGTCISHVKAERDGKICTACPLISSPSFANLSFLLPWPQYVALIVKEQGLFCPVHGFGSPATWVIHGFAVPVPQRRQAAWPKPAGLSPSKAHKSSSSCAHWLLMPGLVSANVSSVTLFPEKFENLSVCTAHL